MPNPRRFPKIHQDQFITDLLTINPNELSANISDRMAAPVQEFEFLCNPDPQSLPADKWILSSAVQKLIRRGRPEEAVKAAIALHTLDPAYLPRRLRIICLEDIGIGDIRTCFDVLHVLSAQKFAARTTDLEQRRLMANLVWRLARSVKSRAACDILCIALAMPAFLTRSTEMAGLGVDHLIKVATNRRDDFAERALALHLLSGLSIQERGRYRTVSRFNADALHEVARTLALPPVIEWVLVHARNTDGLGSMLPLAWEAIAESSENQLTQSECGDSHALESRRILGVPTYALDMHTAIGKRAIKDFATAIHKKHPRLFDTVPSESQLVGMALFHVEGSKLDRWLKHIKLAQYRERIERKELQVLGLHDPASHHELYAIVEAERELLWKFREAHLLSAFRSGH